MSKGKPSAPNLENWESVVISTDLNCVHKERSCDVVFVAERIPKYTQYLVRFAYGASVTLLSNVKCVTYATILQDILNAKNDLTSAEAKESHIWQMFEYASKKIPGKNMVELEETISPIDMSLFIKLQIMKLIENDVLLEKNEILAAKIAEAEKLQKQPVSVPPNDLKKGKGSKAKASNKKTTIKEPCAPENLVNPNSNTLKLCLDTIEVPYKHLIITLVGFFEPELFSHLHANGVPIACLLEITSDNELDQVDYCLPVEQVSQYYATEKKEEVVPRVMSVENFRSISKIANTVRLTQHSSEEFNKLRESRSLKNRISISISFKDFYNFSNFELQTSESSEKFSSHKVSLEVPEQNQCFSLFKRFWNRAYELFQSDIQLDFLKNTFHMKYNPEREVFSSISDMNEFVNECCDIFQTMSIFLDSVPTTVRQYVNYIKNMKLDRLLEHIEAITVENLLTYSNMMKKVSPECFTIPLLLHCLVEEVHNRNEKTPNESWQQDIQRESVFLDKRKEKPPLSMKQFLTKPAKPKLINVVTKRIGVLEMPQCLQQKLELITTIRSGNYESEGGNKIIFLPFKLHENNNIEKVANFYKKRFSVDLFNANIKSLSFVLPALLLRYRFTKLDDIKKLMDESDLQGWCHQLNLPLAKLIDVIHLLLFSTQIRRKSTSEARQMGIKVFDARFPTKTISDQLKQEAVRIEGDETTNEIHNEQQNSLSSERDCKLDKVPKIPYIDLYGIKYSENLKAPVLLQKLFSAQNQYPYFQYRYVPLTDSLLIYFYQSLNKHGTVTDVFNQSLPSPVCIRDFCRFVIHDIGEWLEKEEYENLDGQQKTGADRREDLICNIKFEEEIAPVKGKQAKKDKKKEAKAAEPEVPSNVPPVPPQKVLLPQCASSDKPYAFYGYDLGSSRVQLTGSSSTLYSKDGTTVIVDKTSWLGAEKKTTIKIKLLNNLFVIHFPKIQHNDNTSNYDNDKRLRFHLCLPDDTIICFSKTRKQSDSVTTLYERQCTFDHKINKGHPSSAYKPPQKNVFCFSQKQDVPLNPLSIPFVAKEELVIPPTPIGCFLEYLQKLNENIISNFPFKLDELEDEKSGEGEMQYSNYVEEEYIEETLGNNGSEIIRPQNEDVDLNPFELSDYSPDIIKPTISSVMSDSSCASGQGIKNRRTNTVKNTILRPSKRREIYKFLGIENQLKYPKFKIISSVLHRNEYIKRIKSSVTIQIGESIKNILIKTSFPRARKVVKMTKWYPTFPTNADNSFKHHKFEVQASMKSGLMIATVPGFRDASIQIKQFYVDKGPACSIIREEEFRIFADGMVITKERSGNYKILCADASIVEFEMPHSRKKEVVRLRPPIVKDKYGNVKRSDYVPLGLEDRRSQRQKRKLFKLICRTEKHLINGPNRFLFQRQRKLLRNEKRKFKGAKFYLEENDLNDLIDFHIVTSTGERIRAVRNEPIKRDVFLMGSEVDTKAAQIIFEREDGTHSILDNDGSLTTQFADGTRIKASIVCDENLLIYVSPDESTTGNDTNDPPEEPPEELAGWLFIMIKYEYEHPCYAKVYCNGYAYETSVEFPNKSRIRFENSGLVFVTLNKGVDITISEKNIDILTKPCSLCPCKSECSLDILPFYNEKHPPAPSRTFLRMYDTHGKLFKVTYDGTCKTIIGKKRVDYEHCKHDFTELGKLFVVNRDLSGSKFWDSKLLLKFKMCSRDCTDHSVELHKKSTTNEINCIDFKSIVKKAYFEEFLLPYEYPYLRLKKHQSKALCPKQMVYTTYRIINVIPASEWLAPFYGVIFTAVEKIDTEITDFRSLLARLTDTSLHTDLDKLIQLQIQLGAYEDGVTDWDQTVKEIKPKRRKRTGSRKRRHRQPEMQVQLKIPFENEFITCETELAPEFRQALNSYNKWYSSLFRCRCKTPRIDKPAKCFRKTTSIPKLTPKYTEDAPCAAEIRDICITSKTPPKHLHPVAIKKTCKKQQSVSLESILSTAPCAVDPYLQPAKPDCSLLPKIDDRSRKHKKIKENDENIIVCQIMKLNPLKGTGSPTVITPTEFVSSGNLNEIEKCPKQSISGKEASFGRSSRKFRKPFTIRSSGTDSEFSRKIPSIYNSHGDCHDVNLLNNSNNSSDQYVNKYSDFGRVVTTKRKYEVTRVREGRHADGFSLRNSREMNIQRKGHGNELKSLEKNTNTHLMHPYVKPVDKSNKRNAPEAFRSKGNPALSGNCLRRVSNTINLNAKASSSLLKRESDTKLITAASQAKMIFSGTLYSKLGTSGSTSSLKGNLQYSFNGYEKDTINGKSGNAKSIMKPFVSPDELKDIVSDLSIFDRKHSKESIRHHNTKISH